MEPRYYSKELPESPIYLSSGQPMKFDVMTTSDAWLISELDAAIQNGVGGIISITKAQYDDAIKKKSLGQSPVNSPHSRQEISALHHQPIPPRAFQRADRVAVAGSNPQTPPLPDPLQVPDPAQFIMPKVGKMPK